MFFCLANLGRHPKFDATQRTGYLMLQFIIREGQKAFFQDVSQEDNPYIGEEAVAWNEGWLKAAQTKEMRSGISETRQREIQLEVWIEFQKPDRNSHGPYQYGTPEWYWWHRWWEYAEEDESPRYD